MHMPTATYRLQLRAGTGLAEAERLLPYLADLGISHLYLSPVFRAVSGSTHGYDVTDPAEIEPELGGRAAFSSLAAAARRHGLGIILDIVPNHTAFSMENPWLRDVLRHGPGSRYARHFDIDWSRGKLVLPLLPEPLEATVATGGLRVVVQDEGAALSAGATEVPLAPGPLPPAHLHDDPDTVRDLLAAQHWKLTHWENERDGITHRRFFNVTGLIGMRVEDPAVFDDMHALLFDLVAAGEVQGVRVDHVDGLADPAAYLARLRDRLPDVPIWVEKILTGDERLPDWPVQGTTGYEAGRAIARVLTNPAGLARLDDAWRRETGQTGTFPEALAAAKADIMGYDLSAELIQLVDLARAALTGGDDVDAGDEALREAMLALLVAFPRYRTYFAAGQRRDEDVNLMAEVARQAGDGLRSDRVVKAIADRIVFAETGASHQLRTRFQQVTGALLAKAHEDTAGFRWNRYLAANDVGADPDEATLPVAAFSGWMAQRAAESPFGLTLTSSHDTKRAEDSRMRLVAVSHLPEAFLSLWRDACNVPEAEAVDPNLAWYIVQALLAMWEPGRDDLAARIATHIEKAMREAKQVTNWSHPDPSAESHPVRFAQRLLAAWDRQLPGGACDLLALAARLSLKQLVLKLLMPGIPDIYQGTEIGAYHLTDPDNRLPVDFAALDRGMHAGFDASKAKVTRTLLHLRKAHPDFFRTADARLDAGERGGLSVTRMSGADRLEVTIDRLSLTIRGQIGTQRLADSIDFVPAATEAGGQDRQLTPGTNLSCAGF